MNNNLDIITLFSQNYKIPTGEDKELWYEARDLITSVTEKKMRELNLPREQCIQIVLLEMTMTVLKLKEQQQGKTSVKNQLLQTLIKMNSDVEQMIHE